MKIVDWFISMKFSPKHAKLIGGVCLALGILLLITFKGSFVSLTTLLIVVGALGIGLGGMWENMIKDKKKEKKNGQI